MGEKHGGCGTRLYRIWKDMRRRCNNPNRPDYSRYGGRGITVCAEWDDFAVFRDWAEASGYNDALTIDRIDNDGNYTPGNCRWVTIQRQSYNTRRNVFVTHSGKTQTLTEWAKETGINYGTLATRYSEGLRGKELFGPKKVTMTGKHHTEETKKRIRAKLKGRKRSKPISAETRRKMSKAKRGFIPSNKVLFTPMQAKEIRELRTLGATIESIADLYRCGRKPISRVLGGDA